MTDPGRATGRGRALVVARDLMMRERLERAAEAAGFEVVTSPGPGAQGAALVLADLDEPGMLERIPDLRRANPGARIIGLLSHVDEQMRLRAEAEGVEVAPRGASARPGFLQE